MNTEQTTAHGPTATLVPADFVLGATAFARRCHEVFPGAARMIGSRETAAIIGALEGGVTKFHVVDAFRYADSGQPASSVEHPNINQLRSLAPLAAGEVLEAFAPEDQQSFVDRLFQQFSPRGLQASDRLTNVLELTRGLVSRRSVIDKLAAASSGRVSWLDSEQIDHELVLAGPLPNSAEISIDANLWLQAPPPQGAQRHILVPGWVLAGPGLDIRAGWWELEVSFLQPAEANMRLALVANGGVSTLLEVTLAGPANVAFSVEVLPAHRFVEIRLFKPDEPETLCEFSLQKLALRPQSDGRTK